MCNDKLLHVDHGFPVRMIIPGYIGGRMIKWLTNIDLIATQSPDYYHYYDNRVLPPFVDADLAVAEDWWHRPEFICNELNINSAIATPDHDQHLEVSEDGRFTMQGYAYTGGGRQISRVEVSFDSGVTWLIATLQQTEKPSVYGKVLTPCIPSPDASPPHYHSSKCEVNVNYLRCSIGAGASGPAK